MIFIASWCCIGAFSHKGFRAFLDGFERNIGRLWTPKILKGKKITRVFNKEALTKYAETINRVLHGLIKHQN